MQVVWEILPRVVAMLGIARVYEQFGYGKWGGVATREAKPFTSAEYTSQAYTRKNQYT
jgi:hypothetical protein